VEDDKDRGGQGDEHSIQKVEEGLVLDDGPVPAGKEFDRPVNRTNIERRGFNQSLN
jgi:hypothetical protein